ncbi:ciliary neurotrophic factor receptor subunit alpha preproprotein [Pimephales promelas]|nr:ciliary neurotrophic factor receptor subunit alpha preproprotein [Pimephales promelas]KAG1934972.1 ciliary neurotrophic factor receptor subunit alpha preproprotein [Pimephales promelas]
MKAQPLCFVSIKRPKMCLICFFGALVITSGVFSQDTTTVLPEVREVFAAVGSSVKILCTDGGEKGVEWRFNSSVLISSPVLFMQNTSLKNQGIYTCHQPNGNLILTVSLHLGYPPSPPDVHCWSPTYPKRAICSWTLTPEPILPTHYIATYRYVHSEKKVQKLSLGMYLFKRYTLLYLKGAYWYILAPKMNISTLKLYILVPEMYILAPISI